jgi:hypothetical protein
MTQNTLPNIDPAITNGLQLAEWLNNWRPAIYSQHSGAARPAYAVRNMMWVKETAGLSEVFFFDGQQDVKLGSFDQATHKFTLDIAGGAAIAGALAVTTSDNKVMTLAGGISAYTDLTNGVTTLRSQVSGGAAFIGTPENDVFSLMSNNILRWSVAGAGHFYPVADNAYTLGRDGNYLNKVYSYSYAANAADNRTKYRLYGASGTYGIGMAAGYSFGGLSDYAMTFQMSNDANRGWWFGDAAHSNGQGAMSLTTEGRMTVANNLRVGYGQSDTTNPGSTGYIIDSEGDARIRKRLDIEAGSSDQDPETRYLSSTRAILARTYYDDSGQGFVVEVRNENGGAARSYLFANAGQSTGDSHVFTRGDCDNRYMKIAPTYTSSEQSYVANAAIQVNHGLGRVPANWKVVLRCKTANNGWAVGDELPVGGVMDGDGARGYVSRANSTSLRFFVDSAAIQNSSADYVVPTSSHWKVVFYAW